MGHPKKQRRRYSTPKHMYKGREGEKALVGTYGLKNSRELWKAKSEVARIRALARKLLAKPDEKTISDFMGRLKRMGLLKKEDQLEDVLKLTAESILDRRLQTLVYKRGLATSIKQARQEIVHGHIAVRGVRMSAPGHLATLEEGEQLDFYARSPLKDPEHPVRAPKKASSEERVKAEQVKPPAERGKGEEKPPPGGGKSGEKKAGKSGEKKKEPEKEEKKDSEKKAGKEPGEGKGESGEAAKSGKGSGAKEEAGEKKGDKS